MWPTEWPVINIHRSGQHRVACESHLAYVHKCALLPDSHDYEQHEASIVCILGIRLHYSQPMSLSGPPNQLLIYYAAIIALICIELNQLASYIGSNSRGGSDYRCCNVRTVICVLYAFMRTDCRVGQVLHTQTVTVQTVRHSTVHWPHGH